MTTDVFTMYSYRQAHISDSFTYYFVSDKYQTGLANCDCPQTGKFVVFHLGKGQQTSLEIYTCSPTCLLCTLTGESPLNHINYI